MRLLQYAPSRMGFRQRSHKTVFAFHSESQNLRFLKNYIFSASNPSSYHDSSEEAHRLAAGSVGRHVPVAHCEEGDGYEPQSRVHVARGFLGLPAERERERAGRICVNPTVS